MNAPFKTPDLLVPDAAATAMPAERFLDALFDAGLLTATGVDGLYARSGEVEDVIEALAALYGRWGAEDGATRIHFPPGMPRPTLERSGYLKSFPQLAGCVHSFMGDEAGHARLLGLLAEGGDWTAEQQPTSIALTPAACYPLYPTVAAKGPLPQGGALYELSSYCFRHEPSQDPARMQLFRMKEFVRIGTMEDVTAFRARWMERGPAMIASLGLPFEVDVANDPFFGRAGRMMANNQREGALKFELLIPVTSDVKPTACLSFNYHQDHFGKTWGLELADGTPAHSACIGIGLERTALALFRHHGTDLQAWPASVRSTLWG